MKSNFNNNYCLICRTVGLSLFLRAWLTLRRMDSFLPIGPRTGVIYSRLFKYTQQHTACFTENSIGPRTS
jgi:hypothetical protein